MSISRRFNLAFLTFTLPSLFTIGLFNIAVDPYGVINSVTLPRVNHLKPETTTHNRLFKAIDIVRIKPKTILLGTSRVDWSLDPTHPALAINQPVYNLGLPASGMYELRRYFQHALANQPNLKQVIISLELLPFNELGRESAPDFTETRLEKTNLTPQDIVGVAFSLNALHSSIKTVTSNVNDVSSTDYYQNGMRVRLPKQKAFYTQLGGIAKYTTFRLSNKRLADLKTIINICQQRGIEVKVFITPSHATYFEEIYVAGLWPVWENWKREVVKITPVWDFSGYNSINTEPVSNQMENYLDSFHYSKEVGNLVLNRILDYHEENIPADFGVRITSDNIEFHLAKIRADRRVWAKANPDVVKVVQKLKP